MARFQGDVHAGSDRIAATILFIVLILAVLMLVWWAVDPAGFTTAINNMLPGTPLR